MTEEQSHTDTEYKWENSELNDSKNNLKLTSTDIDI